MSQRWRTILLAFFLTLLLALGESVAIQSMAVTIQVLRAVRPTLLWFRHALRQETGTAVLLGCGCWAVVTLLVSLWRGIGLPAL